MGRTINNFKIEKLKKIENIGGLGEEKLEFSSNL